MKKYCPKEVDMILGVGRPLEDVGVQNWALSQKDALAALNKFAEIGIAVLGGDVYSVNSGIVEPNYDNWYCNRIDYESDSAYVERSIAAARTYIENYRAPNGTVLFAIVPNI